MSEKLRILEMVKDGIISIEEADRLLRALDQSKEKENWKCVEIESYGTIGLLREAFKEVF